jgi:hypothetical protein
MANSTDDHAALAPAQGVKEDIYLRAARALNTESIAHARHFLDQVMRTMPDESFFFRNEEDIMEAVVASFAAFDPQDESERRLCVQIVIIQEAQASCYHRAHKDFVDEKIRDQELRYALKLGQQSVSSVEALDKHRGKGKQKIIVEHVAVHSGGQAIVGEVNARDAVTASVKAKSKSGHTDPDTSITSADGDKVVQAPNVHSLGVRQRMRS